MPQNTGNTEEGDATPGWSRGKRGGEAVKFMGSQTIGSSSCCPSYPGPTWSFFPKFLQQNFTCFLSAGFFLTSSLEPSFENSFDVDTREMEKYEERIDKSNPIFVKMSSRYLTKGELTAFKGCTACLLCLPSCTSWCTMHALPGITRHCKKRCTLG